MSHEAEPPAPSLRDSMTSAPTSASGAIVNLAFEVIWEMPVHRAGNRNDTEYDARAA